MHVDWRPGPGIGNFPVAPSAEYQPNAHTLAFTTVACHDYRIRALAYFASQELGSEGQKQYYQYFCYITTSREN
jgi:hypothetical protein